MSSGGIEYKEERAQKSHSFRWFIRVAASILLAAGLYFLYISNFIDQDHTEEHVSRIITKSTSKGEKFAPLLLPDGSRVYLNAESTLSYPEKFTGNVREVHLAGEGFFEVVNNEHQPFIVKTNDIFTEVLGTSFNINSYAQNPELSISLVSGKVKVSRNAPDKEDADIAQNSKNKISDVILNPGEKISIDKGSLDIKISHFDHDAETGWKDGVLIFQDANHEDLFRELERWYGVNIIRENEPGSNWSVSGRFSNLSLKKVLENLNYTHNITYSIDGKEVNIKFENKDN